MIELPSFVDGRTIERIYGRAVALQNAHQFRRERRAHDLRIRGMNMARDRHPRMLLLLEKGADYLQARNDEQKSRITQEGYASSDFSEYSSWRLAYEKCLDPKQDEAFMFGTLGWVFAAVAEYLE